MERLAKSRPLRQSFQGLAGTHLLTLFRCGSSENEGCSRGSIPANHIRLACELSWAGYAFLDGEMTASPASNAGQPVQGKRPTLTPRHSANLW